MEGNYQFIMHNQYYGCWWPSDTRSQAISNMALILLSQNNMVSAPQGLIELSFLFAKLFGLK